MNHIETLRAALEVISQHSETDMYCQDVAEDALAATAEPAQDDLTAQLAAMTVEREQYRNLYSEVTQQAIKYGTALATELRRLKDDLAAMTKERDALAKADLIARGFEKIKKSMSRDLTNRKLTELQLYILEMTNPEWPTTSPDYQSKRILLALEARKLVRMNYDRWYITADGIAAIAATKGEIK